MSKTKTTNPHTIIGLSGNQCNNMGKFNVTTREKNSLNLEKTFLAEETKSISETKPTKSNFKFTENSSNPISCATKKKQPDEVKTNKTIQNKKEHPMTVQKNIENPAALKPVSEATQIVNAVVDARKYIVKEVSEVFEKKLEKLDDAIVELISSKAENERLKYKIDNLIKENYRLKKEMESFKAVVPGVFIKVKKDSVILN